MQNSFHTNRPPKKAEGKLLLQLLKFSSRHSGGFQFQTDKLPVPAWHIPAKAASPLQALTPCPYIGRKTVFPPYQKSPPGSPGALPQSLLAGNSNDKILQSAS